MINRQIVLSELPRTALAVRHFQGREVRCPVPADGELLLRVLYISLDAASRAWMQGATYRPGLVAGEVMAGLGLAEVVESCSASFQPGDLVCAETGWQTFAVVPAAGLIRLPRLEPLTHLLSVYGVAGLTAYFGLLECVRPMQGETLAVSAAAGAVGSIVGQIARIRGCRTVGIAGGASKCAWLVRELGFDAALDYKTGTLADDLRRTCPDGIDAYFDNTGGAILDACLPNMAEHGRVACCGAISQYDLDRPAAGPAGIPGLLIIKRLTLRGFLLGDFLESRERALSDLKAWVDSGQIKVYEDVLYGLESLPAALVGLLNGENFGKRIVKVA
ncbi:MULTISPECIES: NADP-dependent oxidoreductase [Pseudomonas]|uniref:NADP-dependent oxidoreductase n=1 Tax=Pseudomonas TaxID=286 RepID=UPI0003B9646E|nr:MULTISPECIES: NADP-dependent oxidoreductase [Pseudomonas]KEA30696.1 oxidoreductase [Pseudomonas aeruginosa C0324C]QFZ63102.1 NADP-dependent oxidoreductase [Pseudomonas aeruginosa PA99]HCL2628310.1 NADP-dependent oxidoreductase [Pseudomonas aeruginosa 3C2A]ALV80143.1 Putative NADP-dependent oxidoreductase YfmJ [Pseudomonas aeruginosa]AWF01605.1 zinc-binding dehydrogenase family protein [Pseudomonas aeruginosa]